MDCPLKGMRAYILLSGAAALSACVTPAKGSRESWCSTQFPGHPAQWKELTDPAVFVVDRQKMQAASKRLRVASVVPLSEESAHSLVAGMPVDRSTTPYYLVRSGIFAEPHATTEKYHEQAALAALRLVSWNESKHRLLVHTFQLWMGPREIFNVPLVIRLPVRPVAAAAVCQPLH